MGEGQSQSYSTFGGWNFSINTATDKEDEAREFIRWMTDPEQLKTHAFEASRRVGSLELYDDQEILEKMPVAKLGKEVIIDNTRPRPVSPVYSDMSLELAKQFNAALGGELAPDQAVSLLQKELERIVKQSKQVS